MTSNFRELAYVGTYGAQYVCPSDMGEDEISFCLERYISFCLEGHISFCLEGHNSVWTEEHISVRFK